MLNIILRTLSHAAGTPYTFNLILTQTLIIKATKHSFDLSGTKLNATNQLSVITGHECGNIPSDAIGCGDMTEQIPSTAVWGKKFMVSPFKDRNSQFYHVMAAENSTTYKHNCKSGVTKGSLESGEFDVIKTVANTYCYIEADKPVLVTQMSSNDNLGGTTMSVIPPTDMYVTKTYIYIPNNNDGINSFKFNIISTSNTTTFSLSGVDKTVQWTAITDTGGYTVGYGSQAISSFEVEATYLLTNSEDSEFYIIVYGFGTNRGFSITRPGIQYMLPHWLTHKIHVFCPNSFSVLCDKGYEYGVNRTCEGL